jgi:pimeloyl-ACP methyl ester carboxylesterase
MTPYKIGDSQFGFVHRGFHDIWAASQLVEVAAREIRGRKRIVFTGHSLGGALAQLAALQFAATVGRVPVVYAFGSPRVGDAQWRAAAQSSGFHFRFKHDHDVVPEVPLWGRKPWALTPSWYTHASDAAVRLLETPRTYQCIREFGPTGLDGIADHSLQHYSTLLIDAARN